MKWADFHKQESTWEPASHLSPELTSAFLSPEISTARLHRAAEQFESAIQQRLSSRQTRVVVNCELDVFRHLFSTTKTVLINDPEDLTKLPLCDNWYYKLNKHGKGTRISFPLRITPKLFQKRVYAQKNGEMVSFSFPAEKLIIICAIEPFMWCEIYSYIFCDNGQDYLVHFCHSSEISGLIACFLVSLKNVW